MPQDTEGTQRVDSFLLEEYKTLKTEIESLVGESRVLETSSVVGTAGIYAWLATHTVADVLELAWWIPVGLVALGGFRVLAVEVRIGDIAQYLCSVEKHFKATNGNLGWETVLQAKRRVSIRSKLIGYTGWVFWPLLLLATIAVGFKHN